MKKQLSFAFILSAIFTFTVSSQTGHTPPDLMKLRQQTHPEIFNDKVPISSVQQAYMNFPNQREDFGDTPETDFMKKFGGSGKDEVQKAVADDAGNIYAIIDFSGEMAFAGFDFTSTGKRDVIILKLDSNWNTVWVLHGDGGAESTSILYDIYLEGDQIYISGYFDGDAFSLDGNTVSKTGIEDALLIKLSFDGDVVLMKNIGNAGMMYRGLAVAAKADGEIYLTGSTDGTTHYTHPSFLAKFDSEGNQIWWQEHETAFNDLAASDDFLYISGSAYTAVMLGDILLDPLSYADAFVAQADHNGSYNWAVMGEHNQYLWGDSYYPEIAVGGTGDVFMAGYFRNNVEFGDFLLQGIMESFLVRINPSGEVIWANSTQNTYYELNAFGLLENDMMCISGQMSAIAHFGDITLETPDGGSGHYVAMYNENGQATSAFLVDNPGSGICSMSGEYVLQTGTTALFAFASAYDYAGVITNQLEGSGNSGTSKLTGLETDGNDITYSLNNIHGYADFYGTELLFGNQAMVLSAQTIDGALMWYETIEGGTSWWNYTETTLKLDTNNNNLLFHGDFTDTLEIGNQVFSGGIKESFFASFTTNGVLNWVKIIPYAVNIQSVDCDPDGNVYYVLTFSDTLEIEGQTFVSRSDGDALLLKYEEDGTFYSANQIETDIFFYQVGLAAIPSGGYYLTLEPAGDSIFFNDGANTMIFTPNDGRCVVSRYDENHEFLWAKSFGYTPTNYGGYYCWPTASVTDSDGNLYLTGTHADSAMFGDIMIRTLYNRYSPFNAKIDADGNAIWANSIQSHRWGSNYCEAEIDSEGNFYVMGDIRDTIHFGDWQYVPSGPWDMYVARYDADGEISWAKTFESTSTGNHMYGMAVYEPDNLFVGGNFKNHIFQGDMNLYTQSTVTGDLIHLGEALIPSGIGPNEINTHGFSVFPNPVDDFIYLQFDDTNDISKIEIMDMQGRRMKEIELDSPSDLNKVDVRHLPTGSYFITVFTSEQNQTRKFVIR